ncbi:hypothetical protein KP77_14600 [Jeotgalibacillus alimentarius]|uniref:Uncharacterized protein n=1 Tax=Jeotgalibacillus alimentarius TaxID=135826 RepID=A0A0C2RIV0_9BACL|nr:hypothetical protein KP77_14600 [Jeotgalibacillus alimentarius]
MGPKNGPHPESTACSAVNRLLNKEAETPMSQPLFSLLTD